MTRILIIFSIIISIPNISFAAVVDTCPTTMPVEGSDTEGPIDADHCNTFPGCYWVEGSCKKCPDGKYGAGCTDYCPDPFKNSPVGAKDIYECYATCTITSNDIIANGQITYTKDTVNYNDYGETCDTYKKITCKTTPNDPCQSFHWNDNDKECVIGWRGSETQPDDKCSKYLQYYTSDGWVTTKNCLTCADGYSLKRSKVVLPQPDQNKKCGIDESVGKECMETEISCATALEGKPISTPDNLSNWTLSEPTILGNAVWDSTQYNYSKCSGEYTGTKMGETKTITCKEIDSNTYKWNKCTLGTSTGCPTNQCIMPDEDDCGNAARGYYAENNAERKNIKCQACPGGTTTDGTGKTDDSDCKIKIGGSGTQTEFCDSTGKCFQLNRTDQQYPQYFDIKF